MLAWVLDRGSAGFEVSWLSISILEENDTISPPRWLLMRLLSYLQSPPLGNAIYETRRPVLYSA
jgi:hypothetical protein